jgi:hypothetical protein
MEIMYDEVSGAAWTILGNMTGSFGGEIVKADFDAPACTQDTQSTSL